MSRALSLCLEAVSGSSLGTRHEGTSEWHSSAPHAHARAQGPRVIACEVETEPTYNKPDLANPCLKVM